MSAPSPITTALLAWYDGHRRSLPWRATGLTRPDPYAVWLSEVMLQQTTVTVVKGFYARFLARWPDVASLAAAPRDEVLKEWAGLGYYARARNLHDCAKTVVDRHGGRFPATEAALLALPGVGDYTAAAVASIAFDEPATVVDGNVERVVSRVYAVDRPLPSARPEIRRLTAILVPADRPGDFAQATMDLGATICTPKSPACAICPIMASCAARAAGTQGLYPRRRPKPVVPLRFGAVAVVKRREGSVLARTRPSSGLLGGMTEFPGTSWGPKVPALGELARICGVQLRRIGTVAHVFTHFALELDVYAGTMSGTSTPEGYRWVTPDAIDREPFPTVFVKVWEAARLSASRLVAIDLDGTRRVGLERADEQSGR